VALRHVLIVRLADFCWLVGRRRGP